jgi:hypothetical protein
MSYLPRNVPNAARQRVSLPALGPDFPVIGNALPGLPRLVLAFGGDQIIDYTDADGDWRAHVFLASGTFVANRDLEVEYLVVPGGGGGGSRLGCGGGGGGGLPKTGTKPVSAGSHTITIGGGGAGGLNTSAMKGTSGTNSSALGEEALGGGGGGAASIDDENASGLDGGNGGGAGVGSSGPNPTVGAGAVGGFAGGQRFYVSDTSRVAGGGGGATGAGETRTDATTWAQGGPGLVSTLRGASHTYGVGGRGGFRTVNAADNQPVNSGAANTGNGGDGVQGATIVAAGSGGSGITVIRYQRAA